MTYEERMRRVLIAANEELTKDFIRNLNLCDAIRDLIRKDKAAMLEWTVSKNGKISFK